MFNKYNKSPLLSVIIPVYGVEKYIERCANSLFNQSMTDNVEFIFVDDCSPDNSISIVHKVLQQYPGRLSQVHFLRNESNRGLAFTRQRGMDVARGEYIAHCDSDDWVEPEMYELLLNEANRTDADIVCCNYTEEYNHFNRVVKYFYIEENSDIVKRSSPSILNSSLWNKIIRRSLYLDNNIRWFSGVNMQEDLGMTLRLRVLSKKTVIVSHALYHYNLQNLGAITCVPRLSSVNEQVLCAKLLTQWFEDNMGNDYVSLLKRIRFWAKTPLVVHHSLFDSERWKLVFPETNKDVWKMSQGMPFYNRIPIWFVAHDLDRLAQTFVWLISYLRILKRCFR